MARDKWEPRRPDRWTERNRAFELRRMSEDALEAQASQSLTLAQAARAIDALAGCNQAQMIEVLETHDETELDALQALIEAYLQDRQRRAAARHQPALL